MHATRDELPILFGEDPATVRGVDWGGQRAMIIALPTGADLAPLLRGLPDDLCSCPHWGYMIKGRIHVSYADSVELLQAGDLVYLPLGHTPYVEEDAEFSPPAEHDVVTEVVKRNAAAAPA